MAADFENEECERSRLITMGDEEPKACVSMANRQDTVVP